MSFQLDEQQRAWRTTLRSFLERSVDDDYIRRCDRDREWPKEVWDQVAQQGWLGLTIPEEDGGLGAEPMMAALFAETMASKGVPFAETMTVPMFTAALVNEHAVPEKRDDCIRRFLGGALRFCISITEPDAGSDAASLRLRASRHAEGWKLNGQKLFTSGAHIPDSTLVVAARTGSVESRQKGISLFLVPNDSDGMEIRPLRTLSRRMFGTNEVFFTDVVVADDMLLGEVDEGWDLLLSHLERERVSVAASYVGAAQATLSAAIDYIKQRKQFGRRVSEFQSIRHLVADLQTQLDAARLLVYRSATATDDRRSGEASMAKLFASQVSVRVAREAMVLLGGYGQLPEYEIERHYREAIQDLVGGGTPQIQRSIIAKSMGL